MTDSIPPHNRLVLGLSRVDWKAVSEDQDRLALLTFEYRELAHSIADSDPDAADALQTLAGACSMHPVEGDWESPYVPMIRSSEGRTALPSDLTGEELELLRYVSESDADPLLRARCADLCWLRSEPRRAGFRFALLAISIWEEQPIALETWFGDGRVTTSRALEFCTRFGRKASRQHFASKLLQVIQDTDNAGFCLQLSDMAHRYGLLESEAGQVAERLVSHAQDSDSEPGLERNLRLGAVPWHQAGGHDDAVIQDREAVVRAWLREAESRGPSRGDSSMVAASLLESALQDAQQIPARSRSEDMSHVIASLPGRIRALGSSGLSEMAVFTSDPIDLTSYVHAARRAVRNKDALEALAALVGLATFTDPEVAEAAANEAVAASPFLSLLGMSTFERDGRKIHASAGSGGEPIFGIDPAVWREMIQTYELHVELTIKGAIWPALQVIKTQHHLSLADFQTLVRGAAFVPPEQESMVAQGLYSGYQTSFSISTHVLPPQIEAIVRYHLRQAGVSTSRIGGEGSVETETGLSTLMQADEAVEIFGSSLAFEFRALLCGPLGPNLRNRVAHGLISTPEAAGASGVYLWWLVLKLVFTAYYNALRDGHASEATDGDE